ncbi:MAG: IS3 family transposase [Planctomycetota bacterium]
MNPERRRRAVEAARRRLGHEKVSERRACKTSAQPRGTQRYQPKQPMKGRPLIEVMRRTVDTRPRFGCERVYPELMKQGWSVGFDRVHRLWKQEHMQVPKKQQKRRRIHSSGGSHDSCVRHRPLRRNHVWG